MRTRPPLLQYLLLVLVAGLSLLHLGAGGWGLLTMYREHPALLREPYTVNMRGVVIQVQGDPKGSPIRLGDTLVSINGVRLNSILSLRDATDRTRPGGPFVYVYRSAQDPGHDRQATVTVPDKSRPLWALLAQILTVLLPGVLLVLGLYVVLARPDYPSAWCVLIILGFTASFVLPVLFMPRAALAGSMVWQVLVQSLMPIALMYLGLYFPNRSTFDQRLPWLKWVFAVPLLAAMPLDLFRIEEAIYNWAKLLPYARLFKWQDGIETTASVLAISYFFAGIAAKISSASGDDRRRLRILYTGSAIGLTPFLIILIISVLRNKAFDQAVPLGVLIASIVLFLTFPISLAYVVVVQKAIDLRILIRQGTQYVFARNTLIAIRLLLTGWLAWQMIVLFRLHREPRNVEIVQLLGTIGLLFAFRTILSKRLQRVIDQRFFREAYSAEQVLMELSDEVRGFIEAGPLMETVTQRIGETLHVDRIAVFLRSGDNFRLEFARGSLLEPGGRLALPGTSKTIATLSQGRSPALVYQDDPSSWLVDATDAERAALHDLSTELLVPLPGRGRLAGVMALGPKRSEEPYSRTDRALLQTVASQTGLALENADLLETLTAETAQRERMSREIEIAREVQERLFPQSYPEIECVDMAGYCRPAQVVGGDYYDLFRIENGPGASARLGLAVGDISGKGISASLLMASLRASLRSLARVQNTGGAPDLASLMANVNDLVYEASASNRYATFFFADYDPSTRLLTYVNAGHNPPLLLREGDVHSLEATGTVIGLLPHMGFAQAVVPVQPGDVLLAYTDGVSEAMNLQEEEWGEQQMVDAARHVITESGCNCNAQHLVECLIREADRFTGGAAQHDDMTLVVCRFLS